MRPVVMDVDAHRQATEVARRRAGMSIQDLWRSCFELGGVVDPIELEAYLHGLMPLPAGQRDIIAHAVNERLAELGVDRRVAYSFDGEP